MAGAGTVWLVTGANSGMGLEWVSQVLSLSNTTVVAAARPTDDFQDLSSLQHDFHSRLMIVEMELLDPSTVEETKLVQDAHPQGIDYLINNAGILGSYSDVAQQSIDDFKQVLLVNVVGTFCVTKSVLHLLRLGTKKTIVHISSNAASLSRNHAYIQQEGLTEANLALSYRASKVAINMETSVLANDLKAEGFTVVSLDPGDVSTGMWEYLLQNVYTETSGTQTRQPSLTPRQSVAAMLGLTLRLSTQQSGKFFLYDGQELPW
ncbi:TPA: hypothetical protein ACH3X3_000686 [Trebouxia sp. C0006]